MTVEKEQVEAHRWIENGDHPDDETWMVESAGEEPFLSEGKVVRRYRHPDVSGETRCGRCGNLMHHHGWIDEGVGIDVCPGDFIITEPSGLHRAVPASTMRAMQEPRR